MSNRLYLLLFLAFITFPSLTWGEQPRVLVRGDGFVITENDLNSYLKKLKLPVKAKKRVLKLMVLNKVFALEARKKGISKEEDDLKASMDYRRWFLKNYKVPEIVVESYYYSHYKSYEVDGKMLPLDEKLKEEIAKKIKEFAAAEILKREGKRLLKQYHVEFLHDGSAKSAEVQQH